nr:hypothetical protein [Tanacetum cinerariifolium]
KRLAVIQIHGAAGAAAVVGFGAGGQGGAGRVVHFGEAAQAAGAAVVGDVVLARAPNHAHYDAAPAALPGYLENVLPIKAIEADFLGFGGLEGAVEQGWAAGLGRVALA